MLCRLPPDQVCGLGTSTMDICVDDGSVILIWIWIWVQVTYICSVVCVYDKKTELLFMCGCGDHVPALQYKRIEGFSEVEMR